MEINLITKNSHEHAKEKLATMYKDNFTSAEKKEYIPHHKFSQGPYLAMETSDENSPEFLLDAASQIATLGLGFNATALFGTTMHESAWTGNYLDSTFIEIADSFKELLREKASNNRLTPVFVNSGAEANEVALIMAYKKRAHTAANQIIAFEGSFHGRFLSTLFSTWNPSKREPYQIEGHETTFIKYPETKSDQFLIEIDSEWTKLWENPFAQNFEAKLADFEKNADELLRSEIASLRQLHEVLKENTHFAILVEPMQCEGGDRYSTNRFHVALNLLVKSYKVSVIYDEVQTGFGLGRDFFWHRTFDLKDSQGNQINPEYITCAKKAQSGIVLTEDPCWENNEFQTSSVIRGYYQAIAIDQLRYKIAAIEEYTRNKLSELVSKWDQLSSPRCFGVAFAFDLSDSKDIAPFISNRFDLGLLYYQAGDNTLRFRLNTAWTNEDIDYLFDAINEIANRVYKGESTDLKYTPKTKVNSPNEYLWHSKLVEAFKGDVQDKDAFNFAQEFFSKEFNLELIKIDGENFDYYKHKIEEIQRHTYEPTRQTSIEKFKKIAHCKDSIAIALLSETKQLVGISFAGKISHFPHESGLRLVKYFDNSNTLYMLDTTIVNMEQSQGMGKYLKYALTLLASAYGNDYIYGRNRDIHAGAMLAINCSLGAIIEMRLKENYLDDEEHRDVIIYRQNLKWKNEDLKYSTSPILNTASFESMPTLVNKVCLSNFIDESFMANLKEFKGVVPKELQHFFTASGHSECVEKIFKSILIKNQKQRTKVISFNHDYFGKQSFMSATLSGVLDFYPNSKVDTLGQLKEKLSSKEYLAVFIGDLLVNFSHDELKEVIKIAHDNGTKVVFNESVYFHSKKKLFSKEHGIIPDASYIHIAGQIGICMLQEEVYESRPLMMISTWDGDAYALSQAVVYLKSPAQTSKEFKIINDSSYSFALKAPNIFGNQTSKKWYFTC
ncbi:aminotransferase class III-fold pyridoxal phosphate-dependent enzyme [Halobacteriovorax sp. RZ-1]|uniref:aminotransferase class III-fold pyridoxal phosphate-dependent enzyme n=1 Tax=unclassified Halobacteriovorax TaxID=2639665 RepID=UPI003715F793